MSSNDDKPKREFARLVFRVPTDIKHEVDHYAIDTCRSLNESLIYLVKRGLAAEKKTASEQA